MSANILSRWVDGDLVFYTAAGVDLLKLDATGKVTILAASTLEVVAGATVTGLVAAEAATATTAGAVELATSAESITGTDTGRAVTPKGLADTLASVVPAASATAQGKVELATDAEALAGADTARAVTPHALAGAILKIELIAFAGRAGAGACTATGLKVSDILLSVTGIAAGTVGDQSAKFESVVTVNDQIQQSDAGNLSANIYHALVYRQS